MSEDGVNFVDLISRNPARFQAALLSHEGCVQSSASASKEELLFISAKSKRSDSQGIIPFWKQYCPLRQNRSWRHQVTSFPKRSAP